MRTMWDAFTEKEGTGRGTEKERLKSIVETATKRYNYEYVQSDCPMQLVPM